MIRFLAGLNGLLIVVGLVRLTRALAGACAGVFAATIGERPYFWHFFVGYSAMSVLIIMALALSSYWLFNGRRRGLYLFIATLWVEWAYWHMLGVLASLRTVGMSAAAATGVGNIGLSPQLAVRYPISGLCFAVLLLILESRRPRLR